MIRIIFERWKRTVHSINLFHISCSSVRIYGKKQCGPEIRSLYESVEYRVPRNDSIRMLFGAIEYVLFTAMILPASHLSHSWGINASTHRARIHWRVPVKSTLVEKKIVDTPCFFQPHTIVLDARYRIERQVSNYIHVTTSMCKAWCTCTIHSGHWRTQALWG